MMYSTKNLKLKSEEAADDYVSKLGDTKRYVDQQITWMTKGLDEGKAMPKLVASNCISILENAIINKLDFLRNPLQSDYLTDSDKAVAISLIDGDITESFSRLLTFLRKDYLRRAPEAVGASQMKDGKEFYEQRVRYYTTLDMTPQEVYDVGLSEVDRIKGEMERIINDLEYQGDFKDFITFLREDPQFYAETPQELLNHAAWISMKAQEILPKYFARLPRLPFTVNPVPAAIAPTYTTGRYSGGSMESSKAGEYWVNTYNLPARPMYVLPALTLHEAVPGHHLQISLAKEIKDLPRFRTTQYLSAFGEGWGLYAEYLGKEAGIYTTPYEEFGRLTYEMWRACRLVIDPGIHYFGWTREQAVDYMASNTSLSLHEVNTEIDRYIGWPGQAVSYKIGELKIRELRKRAEDKLGDDFDIKAFHDLILSYGSIPLSTLERIVDGYIEEVSRNQGH